MTEMRPDFFVADYTGQPGERTFFLQARTGEVVHSFLVEKAQVQVLAERLKELLLLVDARDPVLQAAPERDPALRLQAPIEAEFRVGAIALGYDDAHETVVLSLDPLPENEDEEQEEDEPDPSSFAFRFLLRLDQVRSLALHALAVVGEGRPLCQLCGLPMDPGGHVCPASNGHRPHD